MKLNRILLAGVLAAMSSQAVAATDPALIKARQKFFGIENVDANTGAVKKDRVIASWATNTTYVVSVLGRVIMLDSYVTRLELAPGRVPFTIQDLVDVKPEAIMLGHGHFDHADNAAYIAKKSGATVYGAPEHCDQMAADVVRMFNDPNAINGGTKIIPDAIPVPCIALVSRGATPGTEVTRLNFLEPIVCAIALKHMHSNAVPYDPTYPQITPNVTRDTRDAQMYPAGTPLTPPTNVANRVPGQIDIRTSTAGSLSVGGPISLMYQFVLRGGNNFTFLWNNTAGPMKEGIAPDGNWGPAVGANVFNLLASLPMTDVQFGTVATANLANNGMRDPVMYVQKLRPQVFIPGHMTTGTGGVGESSSPEMFFTFKQQIAAMSTVEPIYVPELRWLVDPLDYLRPQTFIPGDARWNNPAKAARVAQFCS